MCGGGILALQRHLVMVQCEVRYFILSLMCLCASVLCAVARGSEAAVWRRVLCAMSSVLLQERWGESREAGNGEYD